MQLKKLQFYDLKHVLINDADFFQLFLEEITVNVTEMFRDPSFFKAFNNQVIPYLSSYQHLKIWSAGCSTGEEVYSLAILLQEAGLREKSFIYGTDVNTDVLKEARRGIYSLRKIKSYAENYQLSGLGDSIIDHFTILYDAATIHSELKQNTLFSVHNLVSDNVFNEFQLILCRNVLIYFDKTLQDKVFNLFDSSLEKLGFLILGSKENLRFSTVAPKFTQWAPKEKIWRKTK